MTLHFQVDPQSPDLETVEKVANVLRDGGLVVFPTETVYGIAALSTNGDAARRLLRIKGRSADKPLTRLVPTVEDALELAQDVGPRVRALMDRYWPGPLTLVLPARNPAIPTGEPASNPSTIGIRIPGSPFALAVLHDVGAPLLVPSANPANQPPATDAEEAKAYFDGQVDAIVDGGEVTIKQSSTVVRVDGDRFEVLRSGIITPEMIHQLFSGRSVLFVCTGNTCRSPMAEALFRKHLAEKIGKSVDDLEESGYRILSAGTFASFGSPASEHADRVMEERGCSLARHFSRSVTADLLAQADRIFVMTPSHRDVLQQFHAETGGAALPIDLLSESGVSDPIDSDLDGYRQCADQIEEAVRRILATL